MSKTENLITPAQLIKKNGGAAKVARRLGFDGNNGVARVSNWARRGIPPKFQLAHAWLNIKKQSQKNSV